MMQAKIRLRLTPIIGLICLLWLVGCTGKSPRADFYALGATPASGPVKALTPEIALAIGPVTIPAELDRKQIVTRDAGNRVKVAELSRWAAPLQDSITAVLAANLASQLGTDRVAPHNRESLFPFTHQLSININRFDGHPEGSVLLDATWSIKQNGVPNPLVLERSQIREPVATPDYNGMVAAQSKALAELGTLIAAALRELSP